MAAILGARGVKPEMKFRCCDCGDIYTGTDVINRTQDLYLISVPKDTEPTPENIRVRCECCQDEYREIYSYRED